MPRVLESPPDFAARRKDYVHRVHALTAQLSQIYRAAGFDVVETSRVVEHPAGGADELPTLTVSIGADEVHTKPYALDPSAGLGRVDLQAWPTLSRVKLIAQPDGGWTVMTNSRVPLRIPWTPDAFAQLARDLVGQP